MLREMHSFKCFCYKQVIKLDNMIPETHMVERENWLHKQVQSIYACVCTCNHKHIYM